MPGLVVHRDLAGATFRDDVRDGLDVAIEQIGLAPRDTQPSAADDPWTPAADRRHLCCLRRIGESAHGLQQTIDVEWPLRGIIQADIVVRGVGRRAARARPAERDRGDAGHFSERRDDALQDRIRQHAVF